MTVSVSREIANPPQHQHQPAKDNPIHAEARERMMLHIANEPCDDDQRNDERRNKPNRDQTDNIVRQEMAVFE